MTSCILKYGLSVLVTNSMRDQHMSEMTSVVERMRLFFVLIEQPQVGTLKAIGRSALHA